MKKLTGSILQDAFQLDHADAQPFAEISTRSKLDYEKVCNALNVLQETCTDQDIVYILTSEDTDTYVHTSVENMWNMMISACNEDDECNVYLIRNGRQIGYGWYKMCQNWTFETIAEYDEASGLYAKATSKPEVAN